MGCLQENVKSFCRHSSGFILLQVSDPSSFSWERKTTFSTLKALHIYIYLTYLRYENVCCATNPRYLCALTYLPDFTRRKLKSLLQLVSDGHVKEHGPFPVCEGDWNWEHDAIWEIVVPYTRSQRQSHFISQLKSVFGSFVTLSCVFTWAKYTHRENLIWSTKAIPSL